MFLSADCGSRGRKGGGKRGREGGKGGREGEERPGETNGNKRTLKNGKRKTKIPHNKEKRNNKTADE